MLVKKVKKDKIIITKKRENPINIQKKPGKSNVRKSVYKLVQLSLLIRNLQVQQAEQEIQPPSQFSPIGLSATLRH